MPDPTPPEDPRKKDPLYSPRTQTFEVVCIKADVSDGEALPEHFKRVSIQADSTYRALQDPKIDEETKAGFRALFAAVPGVLTDVEILAQQRALNAKSGSNRKYFDGDPPRR